jgi:hypothetical protein
MYHIDNLRIGLKINVIDFVQEICSDRQYRRYLSGTSVVSQRMIRKFCDKLNITAHDFYNSFHLNDVIEYKKVTNLYHSIQKSHFENALKLIEHFDNHNFLSPLSKDFFSFCNIFYRHKSGNITKHYAHELYGTLIDYPQMLNKPGFNFIEITVLLKIASIESSCKKTVAAEKLYHLLNSRDNFYLSSNTRYILPPIYVGLSKIFWRFGETLKCIQLIDEGIEYSLSINDMLALPELFYLKAYMLKTVEHDENKALIYANKCLNLLIIKNDDRGFKRFKNLLAMDFGDDFIRKIN